MNSLGPLSLKTLQPTRDYLQDVSKILGKLQQAFLPVEPYGWQYGLEVNMRGLSTQVFMVNGKGTRASIDLVRQKVRLWGSSWPLQDYSAAEIMKNMRTCLESRGLNVHIEEPDFASGKSVFDGTESYKYAAALWWVDRQLSSVKAGLSEGNTSPILLYPHHFDLALDWLPFSDKRQLSLGWSTGDENIAEPYIYLTAYPEPDGFTDLELPAPAFWSQKGFSGAVLLYGDLAREAEPEKVFAAFAGILERARSLQ